MCALVLLSLVFEQWIWRWDFGCFPCAWRFWRGFADVFIAVGRYKGARPMITIDAGVGACQ